MSHGSAGSGAQAEKAQAVLQNVSRGNDVPVNEEELTVRMTKLLLYTLIVSVQNKTATIPPYAFERKPGHYIYNNELLFAYIIIEILFVFKSDNKLPSHVRLHPCWMDKDCPWGLFSTGAVPEKWLGFI